MAEEGNPNPNYPISPSMDSSSPSSQPKTPDSETLTVGSDQPSEDPKPAKEEEREEEEEECGFCLFMKGGGCKDEFVQWEKCVEDAEKSGADIADKCFDITQKMKVCMEAHADYYEPLLSAEKGIAESASETGQERSAEAAGGAASH